VKCDWDYSTTPTSTSNIAFPEMPFVIYENDTATGQSRMVADPATTPIQIAHGDWRVSPDGQYVVYVNSSGSQFVAGGVEAAGPWGRTRTASAAGRGQGGRCERLRYSLWRPDGLEGEVGFYGSNTCHFLHPHARIV